MRLFAGDRIYRILDRLGPVAEDGEEQPIEAKMLSKQIEGAQKKVEEQNFLIRKRVLEYDDVMNQQREIIYEYRERILEGQDMSERARESCRGDRADRRRVHVRRLRRGLGVGASSPQLEQIFPVGLRPEDIDRRARPRELVSRLREDVIEAYESARRSSARS